MRKLIRNAFRPSSVLLVCGVLSAFLSTAAETPERLYQQALRSFSEQRYDVSESLLREAVKQRPKWFEARFLLGASLVTLGRTDEAIEELKAAHRLNPAHLDCVKLLASEYLGLERTSEALTLLRPLVARQSADEELLLLAIEARHVRSEPGDSDEAMRLSARGLARFPRSARMLAWRGYALRDQGALPDARKALESALAIAPDDSASKAMLADVIRREGRNEEALRLFDQVLAVAPADEEALIGKGRTLAALGKLTDAIEAFRIAVRIAPESARLHLELSQLYAKADDRESAAREAEEFRRLRSTQPERTIPVGLRSAGASAP